MTSDVLPENFEKLVDAAARASAEAVLERLGVSQVGAAATIQSPLMTVKETALYLKLSRNVLFRLERAGVLKPKRIGRRVFYIRADLDHYIRIGGAP